MECKFCDNKHNIFKKISVFFNFKIHYGIVETAADLIHHHIKLMILIIDRTRFLIK